NRCAVTNEALYRRTALSRFVLFTPRALLRFDLARSSSASTEYRRSGLMDRTRYEPSLDELLGDVAIRLLMERDGVTENDLRAVLAKVKEARALAVKKSSPNGRVSALTP